MSNLIHCDGPGCDETKPDERRLCDAPWFHVERDDVERPRDFHSEACMARWAVGGVGDSARDVARNVLDNQPCTCHAAQADPHTKAEHQAYPTVVDGR